MPERILTRIADVVFAISADRPLSAIRFGEAYRDFVCDREPEVTIHARYGALPPITLRDEELVFDSEVVWSLYRSAGADVFALRSPLLGPEPYRIAIFRDGFRRGEVYSQPCKGELAEGALLSSPLEFPLAEVLMICLMARGRGLMVHACGIDDGGRGYLFAGNSTHGKSTMARIWRDEATILNDDRIVLRWREGRFWMYGTPWHGDYSGVSPRGVPLEKLFFLRHATENELRPQAGTAAATKLLTRSFLPLWDAEGMAFSLDFCARVTGAAPCYELGFVPDQNVIDFVR